ncbi:cobalamin B12-binding domain-containing protein [Belnapia sp. T6]|uniref:Cobalamin B12-binding domain-containing protein n=1 Tax=Belnapia mucosa TaxID=2804532 RepID=A0ABS1V300_9PROT|nr:cobalamin B12-binding domain-containing protein [Belnapia mucosa]MBL6455662.1 cobalamin B12-binding domain-containing protein [Belnapia mucosa]
MAAMGGPSGTSRNLAQAMAEGGPAPLPPAGRPGHSPRFGDALAAEVIPRLRLAHADRAPILALAESGPVDVLGAMLLRHDAISATAYVEMLHRSGTSAEDLCLDLLAPVARLLGHWWADDVCDFVTVTLGVLHLRRLREAMLPRLLQGAPLLRPGAPSILLAPVPGEQHVFGLEMVADFFRRAGWHAMVVPVRSIADLTGLLRREHVDILGLSSGAAERMDVVARTIRKARQSARNRCMGVMVGGPAFDRHPGQAPLVGADAMAADARTAPVQAARLMQVLGRRPGQDRHDFQGGRVPLP